jgi:hypothetical protein
MTECTCRGGNPNCFKCGGFGIITKGKPQNRWNPIETVNPDRSLCPYCNHKFESGKKLVNHIVIVHSEMKHAEQELRKKVINSSVLTKNSDEDLEQ